MLLCSLLNGTMQCSASSSAILTCRMQVRQKGAIHLNKAPKKVNRTKAVQVVLLLVQITSRSPNFLANVSFSRNQDIKLQIAGRELACSICLGCLAQPKQNKNLFSSPLGKLKSKKRSTSPLDLASGSLGGAAIAAAAASCMQQPNCNSMPNIACDIVTTVTDHVVTNHVQHCMCSCYPRAAANHA